MRTSGVYGWRNTVTGKWYIGSSVHIERRKTTHLKELGGGTHNGPKLLRAWQKYGSQMWEFVILEECKPVREVLVAREQHWLDLHDSHNNGYNTLPKAGSALRDEVDRGTTLEDHSQPNNVRGLAPLEGDQKATRGHPAG